MASPLRCAQLRADRHTHLAWVAILQIQLDRKVRRLIAEVEALHRVRLVKDIAGPDTRAPSARVPAQPQIDQRARLRSLVMAGTEVKAILGLQIGARKDAHRMLVTAAQ